MYKIVTKRWIEGYEIEVFEVEAKSIEEAKELIENFEIDPIDSDVNIKNAENLEFIIEEEINE